MKISNQYVVPSDPLYPDSDGERIAENTLQFDWIALIYTNLEAIFANRPDVFVAGDLFWYPVEGCPDIRTAPDGLVAFGRPQGHRGSYRQWMEEGVSPQVVFEVLSESNRGDELDRKFEFYDRYGVEEYYICDPDERTFTGWLRTGPTLAAVPVMDGWVSPRLGVRFAEEGEKLRLYRPSGERFMTFVEKLEAIRQLELQNHEMREYAERRERAVREAEEAHRRAEASHQQAEEAKRRADRMATRLRELGVDPEAI